MPVFDHQYADQYDALYLEKDYAGECDLIEAALGRFGNHAEAVLDIGCGTGSHVLELARRGYACTGVDLSQSMLDVARAKVESSQFAHTPEWLRGDARTFSVSRPFDLAVMMFAVISYLTSNEDIVQALRNIRQHLKPGALFMCDFWYGPAVLSVRPSERVRELVSSTGKVIRAAKTTVDSFTQTADVSFRLWTIAGDRLIGETDEVHRMRYFFAQELTMMMTLADFDVRHISAFPSLDAPVTDQTWNAFMIAQAT
jgi:SAM-dependent methyltransferase